jgi:hypothetical protein
MSTGRAIRQGKPQKNDAILGDDVVSFRGLHYMGMGRPPKGADLKIKINMQVDVRDLPVDTESFEIAKIRVDTVP